MKARRQLLFVSMLGAPGIYDPALYADQPGGDDETCWVRLMLEGLGLAGHLDYRGVRVCCGETLPAPQSPDAVLLGGSWHSVHDDLPWQRHALDWLRRYRATGRPLLAICGGHQLVAFQRGAKVVTMAEGPFAGSLPVVLTPAGRRHFLFEGFPDRPVFHFANCDAVAAPPAGAVLLAEGPRATVAALDFGDGWLGVQFHPEATHDSLAASWLDSHPEFHALYRPLPDAPRLIRNFLTGSGIVA